MDIKELAKNAYAASLALADTESGIKNRALAAILDALKKNSEEIFGANREDLANAEKDRIVPPLLKRLKFDQAKLNLICSGIEALIRLDDPIGRTLTATELDKGFELYKVSCPIGVIGIVFESRPDALIQIATLCLKSGNAVLLKGGKEALATNKVLARLIRDASVQAGLPQHWITLLETREDVAQLLSLNEYINLIIPRGSNQFVQYIMENTRIPVLGHADGICHVYVDSEADIDMACSVTVDSKCQYVAVCNAAETLLVHTKTANAFLPKIKTLLDEKNVELRGCGKTQEIISVKPAAEEDWTTEYLDYILSIKIVDSLQEAVSHINTYGSHHTDTIVTSNRESADKFLRSVDSANTFVNCSTRFADGYVFGLGAEVGISTNKIHARGPVGMEGLCIYKWMLVGSGQVIADYASGKKHYTHKPLDRKFK